MAGRSHSILIVSWVLQVRFNNRGSLGPATSVVLITGSEGIPSFFFVKAFTQILYSAKGSVNDYEESVAI